MNATVAASPLVVAALLLIGAGGAKVLRPGDTARALRRAGLPVTPVVVRGGAGFEVCLGVAALFVGGPVIVAAVGLSYVAFAGFVAAAMARGWPLASCGCFGEPDAPPTALHVLLDLALAGGVAAGGSVGGGGSGRGWAGGGAAPAGLVLRQPALGAATLLLSVVIAGLAYLLLSRLPELRQAVRSAG